MKVPMPKGGFGMGGGGELQGQDNADGDTGSLSEEDVESSHAAKVKKWKAVFARLHKNYGVDLRDQVNELLKLSNSTNQDFLCMPALVPLDKHTAYGPLFVVGTPLLDSYYARWSYGKDDKSPKVHLKALTEAKVCGGEEQAQKAPPANDDKAEKKPEKHD